MRQSDDTNRVRQRLKKAVIQRDKKAELDRGTRKMRQRDMKAGLDRESRRQ
jgi:hypothetical protein